MRSPRHLSLAGLVAGLVLSVGSSAQPAERTHDAAKKRGCAAGRFVVTQGQELLGGASDPTVLVVEGSLLRVEGPCPGTGKASTNARKPTRLVATWEGCGTLPKLRLRATARDCSTVRGKLRARKRHQALVATASICGDGVVDRGGGEECDGTQGCEAGVQCSASCQCDGPAPEPLECVVAGYPCKWSEVSADVRAQSIALADAADAVLASGGTVSDAVQTLKAAGLAELQYDVGVIRFRLPGGRPVWLVTEAAATPILSGPNEAQAAPDRDRAPAGIRREIELRPRAVVSTGTLPKTAYLLDPYAWEFHPWDVAAPSLAAILETVEDYEGNVAYRGNATVDASGVSVPEFTQFKNHNVVIVNTHGTTICNDLETKAPIPCRTIILARKVTDVTLATADAEAQEPGVDIVKYATWHLGVSADFFRHHYPGGLRDALVMFNACSSRKQSDVARALEGRNTNFVGWSKPHAVGAHGRIGRPFLAGLAQGRAIAEVYASMGAAVQDPLYGGVLQIGSQSIRIRELPRAMDAFTGKPLTSSSTIQVTGYPDDGLPDGLLLLTEFVGVRATEGSQYVVHITVDGVDMGSKPLSEVAAPVGEYEWRGEATLDLGYDVTEGQPLDIRITVDLPEGGTSVFVATPKVTGERFLPGRVWQGTFTRTSMAGAGLHWALHVTATFERDPSESATSKYPTYLLKSGSMTWSLLLGSECNYSGTTTTTPLGANEYNYFTFDLTKQPIEFSGAAQSDGPPVNVTVDCPDLGDTAVSVEAGGSWFLAPSAEHYTVTGPSIAGSFNNGSELASTFEWSLTRVE